MKLKHASLGLILFAVPASAQTPEVIQNLEKTYTYVGPFVEGMAVVSKKSIGKNASQKFGYVDTLGRLRVPVIYDYADNFTLSAAIVGAKQPDSLRYGYVNREGKLLAWCEWEQLEPMYEGMGVAKNGTEKPRYAIIDSLGNKVDLNYDFCSKYYYEGLVAVGRGQWVQDSISGVNRLTFEGKYGFIDKKGHEVIKPRFDQGYCFAEGLAAVGIISGRHMKWGYIDKQGRTVVPFNYYDAESFSNGLAIVARIGAGGNLIYGYINKSGREVIPCQYATASSFNFDNTWVGRWAQNGECIYTFINRSGRPVNTQRYYRPDQDSRLGFSSCAILINNKFKYGVIDKEGKTLIPFQYDDLTIFSIFDNKEGKWINEAIGSQNGQEAIHLAIPLTDQE